MMQKHGALPSLPVLGPGWRLLFVLIWLLLCWNSGLWAQRIFLELYVVVQCFLV